MAGRVVRCLRGRRGGVIAEARMFPPVDPGPSNRQARIHPVLPFVARPDPRELPGLREEAANPHAGRGLHVVLDDLSTHTAPEVKVWP